MREVIILAGGKGTRLQHLLQGIPKCMAPVRNIPFLSYLIEYLIQEKTDHFIFSLGHLHQEVISFIDHDYPHLNKTIVIEDQPLGTGGAILKSMDSANSDTVFIVNGDTYFPVSLDKMEEMYLEKNADLVIASTQIQNPDRFGTLETDSDCHIIQFHEKRKLDSGFINGGTYLIAKNKLRVEMKNPVFSFESDVLEAKVKEWRIYASAQDSIFIDIGIPEDYLRASDVLPKSNHK